MSAEPHADPARRVVSSGADQPYWDALEDDRVEMQCCGDCGRWHWPAVWRCGECGSWHHTWATVQPEGAIYTWTRTWHPFGGLEATAKPFVSLVVTIDGTDGRRLTGILEGAEDGLAIGARVRARIVDQEVMGRSLPALRWTLVGEAG